MTIEESASSNQLIEYMQKIINDGLRQTLLEDEQGGFRKGRSGTFCSEKQPEKLEA